MYPAKHLLTLLLSLSLSVCLAQHNARNGSLERFWFLSNDKKIDPVLIERLKTTTTVFFYTRRDVDQLDELKTAVTNAWKLTPVIFVDISEFDKYQSDTSFSLFTINCAEMNVNGNQGLLANQRYDHDNFWSVVYLTLQVPSEGRRGKPGHERLCRIDLCPDMTTIREEHLGGEDNMYTYNYWYNNANIQNWTPASLSVYLRLISANITQGVMPNEFKNFTDKAGMDSVSKDTLFVPDYVLEHIKSLRNEDGPKDYHLFDKYPFKYKICTTQELNDRFVTGNTGRFMFDYVRTLNTKILSIYDMSAGTIVFRTISSGANLNVNEVERIFTDRHGRLKE